MAQTRVPLLGGIGKIDRPILSEALQEQFPPEDGYTIEHGTWLERDELEPVGSLPTGWLRSRVGG